MVHFDGSVSKALVTLFPDINFDLVKFARLGRRFTNSLHSD